MSDETENIALFNDLLERFIKPNTDAIVKIAQRGDVAVLVGPDVSEDGKQALYAIGWDGAAPVLAMPNKIRPAAAQSDLNKFGDIAMDDPPPWLTPSERFIRLLVFVRGATLWVNWGVDMGWYLDPENGSACYAAARLAELGMR